MEHLQSQWYEVKRPLDEELKHLELAQGHKVKKIANSISSNAINISLIQNESQLIQDEIADMNSKIAEINMDEVIKTKMISKLVGQKLKRNLLSYSRISHLAKRTRIYGGEDQSILFH